MNFETIFIIENIILSVITGYVFVNYKKLSTKQFFFKSCNVVLSTTIDKLSLLNDTFFANNNTILNVNDNTSSFSNYNNKIKTFSNSTNHNSTKHNNVYRDSPVPNNQNHDKQIPFPNLKDYLKVIKPTAYKQEKNGTLAKHDKNNILVRQKKLKQTKHNDYQNISFDDNTNYLNTTKSSFYKFTIESYDDEDDIYFDCNKLPNDTTKFAFVENSLPELYEGCLLDKYSKSMCDTFHSINENKKDSINKKLYNYDTV